MRILVVCQHYFPEPFRIHDICEALVERGHEVQVITGFPNYPEGVLYAGYDDGEHSDELINGVKVHRCYTIPRKSGVFFRFLNYYSFAFSSVKYVKSLRKTNRDKKPYDVVFCNQLSPVMMANAAVAYKKYFKVPAVMYCLDLWPQSLRAGGIPENSIIYKYYHRVSEKIYRAMDKIFVSSRMFSDYLNEEFGLLEDITEYLPQYAENFFSECTPKKDTGVFDFTFAGNIGTAQSVDTIIKAARILKDKPIRFHIVGGGSDCEALERESQEDKNIIFYGRRPVEEMMGFYEKTDAMIITMKDDPVLNYTLPGKVQSYMAAGKPIIGAIGGETAKVVSDAGCGYCGEPENPDELALNILRFINDPDRELMGKRARQYYKNNFDKKLFIDKLEATLASFSE